MPYRTHRNLNTILVILYIPITFFGLMMGMAIDAAMDETNRLIIAGCYSMAYLGMLSPIAAYGGLLLSRRLYDKGRIAASHFARFLGLIFIAAAFFFDSLFYWLSGYFG